MVLVSLPRACWTIRATGPFVEQARGAARRNGVAPIDQPRVASVNLRTASIATVIVWQGWGSLSFLCFLAVGILGIGAPHGAGVPVTMIPFFVIPAAAVFAGLNWWLGMRLNQWGPKAATEAEYATIEANVRHSVLTGHFSLGPGAPRPSSLQEAQAQAEHYLAQIRVGHSRAFNRHRLFWIPMQHITWVIAAFGLIVGVASIINPG